MSSYQNQLRHRFQRTQQGSDALRANIKGMSSRERQVLLLVDKTDSTSHALCCRLLDDTSLKHSLMRKGFITSELIKFKTTDISLSDITPRCSFESIKQIMLSSLKTIQCTNNNLMTLISQAKSTEELHTLFNIWRINLIREETNNPNTSIWINQVAARLNQNPSKAS